MCQLLDQLKDDLDKLNKLRMKTPVITTSTVATTSSSLAKVVNNPNESTTNTNTNNNTPNETHSEATTNSQLSATQTDLQEKTKHSKS